MLWLYCTPEAEHLVIPYLDLCLSPMKSTESNLKKITELYASFFS